MRRAHHSPDLIGTVDDFNYIYYILFNSLGFVHLCIGFTFFPLYDTKSSNDPPPFRLAGIPLQGKPATPLPAIKRKCPIIYPPSKCPIIYSSHNKLILLQSSNIFCKFVLQNPDKLICYTWKHINLLGRLSNVIWIVPFCEADASQRQLSLAPPGVPPAIIINARKAREFFC